MILVIIDFLIFILICFCNLKAKSFNKCIYINQEDIYRIDSDIEETKTEYFIL